jgi:hypothetical protein
MPAKREKLKPGETLFGGRGVMIPFGNFGKKIQSAHAPSDSILGADVSLLPPEDNANADLSKGGDR